MTTVRVPVVENILNANDFVANENRKIFSDHKIFASILWLHPELEKLLSL
jgi:hypothetical protein